MARPKILKKGVCVRLMIEEDHLRHLEKCASLMSAGKGRIITISEFIRMTLSDSYPVPKEPKQMELF